MENWDAMDTIYQALDHWDGVIHARLTQIKLFYCDDVTETVKAVIKLLEYMKEEIFCDEKKSNKDTLLYQILEFWQAVKLPVRELSKYILSHLSVLGPILGLILRRSRTVENPFCVKFSLKVQLLITKSCLDQMKTNYYKENQQKMVTDNQLWSEIKEQLTKSIDKKDKIIINCLEPSLVSSEITKDYAFTCGHYFNKFKFNEVILPTFYKKMSTLPLPMTLHLMSFDYQQTETSLACPACVFNELRKKHREPSERWEI